jgi:hypothetical protein
VSHDDDLVVGIIQSLDRWADTLLVSGCGVVKREIGGKRAVAEHLEPF